MFIAMSDVTRILSQIEQGNPQAAEELLPLVYEELRKLAAAKLAQEKPGQTLQATALVHEAWLRLVGTKETGDGNQEPATWDHRGHFFAAAAEAMRRILVENARRKARNRHGGGRLRVEFPADVPGAATQPEEILAVHEALDELARVDGQAAQLVKLHYFGGLTIEEAALLLSIPPRTAYRNWSFARAWLFRHLQPAQ
jgi:RNA polymerase sigma factor (TIGR02999 family)